VSDETTSPDENVGKTEGGGAAERMRLLEEKGKGYLELLQTIREGLGPDRAATGLEEIPAAVAERARLLEEKHEKQDAVFRDILVGLGPEHVRVPIEALPSVIEKMLGGLKSILRRVDSGISILPYDALDPDPACAEVAYSPREEGGAIGEVVANPSVPVEDLPPVVFEALRLFSRRGFKNSVLVHLLPGDDGPEAEILMPDDLQDWQGPAKDLAHAFGEQVYQAWGQDVVPEGGDRFAIARQVGEIPVLEAGKPVEYIVDVLAFAVAMQVKGEAGVGIADKVIDKLAGGRGEFKARVAELIARRDAPDPEEELPATAGGPQDPEGTLPISEQEFADQIHALLLDADDPARLENHEDGILLVTQSGSRPPVKVATEVVCLMPGDSLMPGDPITIYFPAAPWPNEVSSAPEAVPEEEVTPEAGVAEIMARLLKGPPALPVRLETSPVGVVLIRNDGNVLKTLTQGQRFEVMKLLEGTGLQIWDAGTGWD